MLFPLLGLLCSVTNAYYPNGYDGTEGPAYYYRRPASDRRILSTEESSTGRPLKNIDVSPYLQALLRAQHRMLQGQSFLPNVNPANSFPFSNTGTLGRLGGTTSGLGGSAAGLGGSPAGVSGSDGSLGGLGGGAAGLGGSNSGLPGLGGLGDGNALLPGKSVADIWNDVANKLAEDAKLLALPQVDYNFSLPEVPTVGNLASLPALSEGIGANLGNTLGKTTGNILSGTANLWGNTLSGAADNFLTVFSPTLSELAKMFSPPASAGATPAALPTAGSSKRRRLNTQVPPTPDFRMPRMGLPVLTEGFGHAVGASTGTFVGNAAHLLSSTGRGFMNAFIPTSGMMNSWPSALGPKPGPQSIGGLQPMSGAPQAGPQAIDNAELSSRLLTAKLRRRLAEVAEDRPECALVDTQYLSLNGTAFDNVASLRECQKICQLYSTPPIPDNCYISGARLTESDECLGVSFYRASGQCSIFRSISGSVRGLSGIDSAPVVCPTTALGGSSSRRLSASSTTAAPPGTPIALPGTLTGIPATSPQAFHQTVSAAQELASLLKGSCPSYDLDLITLVDDNAKPQPSRTPAKAHSKMNPFPVYNNPSEPSEFYQANPPWPAAQSADFKIQSIVQPLTLSESATGIAQDWRLCAYLCNQRGEKYCGYWSYVFPSGDCALAPPSSVVLPIPDNLDIKTITGPFLPTPLPDDLFAAAEEGMAPGGSNAVGSRRLTAVPDNGRWVPALMLDQMRPAPDNDFVLPEMLGYRRLQQMPQCTSERNVLYYSPYVQEAADGIPLSEGVLATTEDECVQVCNSMPTCLSYQFIPPAELSASSRLYNTQKVPCMLLASIPTTKITLSSVNVVSGVREGTDPETCPRFARTLSFEATPSVKSPGSGPSPPELQAVIDGDASGCIDSNSNHHNFATGTSLRGTLLEGTENVLRGVLAPEECRVACLKAAGCGAWSWGKWSVCYLFSEIEQIVADDAMIAGRPQCKELDFPQAEASKVRELQNCSKVYRGQSYTGGRVIGTVEDCSGDEVCTADDCWRRCRHEAGCLFMTVHNGQCQMFGEVGESVSLPAAVSAESNCDILGTVAYGEHASYGTVRIVAGATVGVAALLGSAIAVKLSRSRNRNLAVNYPREIDVSPNLHKTPAVVRLDAELEGEETRQKRRWNVFGMGSPDPASPGALERGSPKLIKVDDFQTVEKNVNKSTGKRFAERD